MDELHKILIAYEMRTEKENPVMKEATFKASKKIKKKYKQKENSDCSCNDHSKEDEEVDIFVRRLKTETNKYKGKLTLICFNCDGVGNFSNKCPYKKNKINEEEDDPKKKNQIQKGRRNKKKNFKKILCTKADSSSLDEDEVNDNDIERVLFMEI
jgi:hypothetical protein